MTDIKLLLGCSNIDINNYKDEEWPHDKTALYTASLEGHVDVVKELLSHPNINVNKGRISNGAVPLYTASRNGQLEVVKELLMDARVDPNIQCGRDNRTSLMAAIEKSKINVVELLLRCPRVDITLKENRGETALDIATNLGKHSYVSIIQSRLTLLQEGHTCPYEQGEIRSISSTLGAKYAYNMLLNLNAEIDNDKTRTCEKSGCPGKEYRGQGGL